MPKKRLCLPTGQWPAVDRACWHSGLCDPGLFEGQGVAMSWRPRTVETVAEGYGYALAWLERHGRLASLEPPAARWTAEVLRAYVTDMKGHLSDATVVNRVLALERALTVIAPKANRVIFRALIRNLSASVATRSKRPRLRDPAQLVELGHQLMADADVGVDPSPRKNAVRYRDGLQIALLALRPLRKRNFAGLQIGTHLVEINGRWWLIIPAEETKTARPVEVPFPEQLVPAMMRYFEHYRPLLANGRYCGDRLWLSYWHSPQAAHSIQLQIAARTQAAFGTSVNPHLFRDCVATSIAIHDPVNVRMAATILGHGSFATTEKHYNLARTLEASRGYGEVIAKRRAAISQLKRSSA